MSSRWSPIQRVRNNTAEEKVSDRKAKITSLSNSEEKKHEQNVCFLLARVVGESTLTGLCNMYRLRYYVIQYWVLFNWTHAVCLCICILLQTLCLSPVCCVASTFPSLNYIPHTACSSNISLTSASDCVGVFLVFGFLGGCWSKLRNFTESPTFMEQLFLKGSVWWYLTFLLLSINAMKRQKPTMNVSNKPFKYTSLSCTVALADMFLHYTRTVVYFDSISHAPSVLLTQILTRAPTED